ncbi:unnamed protein product [Strongylus vulgaris]|uniref:Uncharacterized protein n=1 Tax=Strongylus vulgaris TaxID=40348 RepID=A0A3P7KMW5_STRVU|nr:unnamed protein product [Strongylus vulgaris]
MEADILTGEELCDLELEPVSNLKCNDVAIEKNQVCSSPKRARKEESATGGAALLLEQDDRIEDAEEMSESLHMSEPSSALPHQPSFLAKQAVQAQQTCATSKSTPSPPKRIVIDSEDSESLDGRPNESSQRILENPGKRPYSLVEKNFLASLERDAVEEQDAYQDRLSEMRMIVLNYEIKRRIEDMEKQTPYQFGLAEELEEIFKQNVGDRVGFVK